MSRELRPGVEAGRFLAAARQVASAVTVATASDGERAHAITATAFCPLSLDPPLVLLALDRAGQLLHLVRRARHLGVNILAAHQAELGRWAATRGRPLRATLPGVESTAGATGAPLLAGSLAWFDCELESDSEHGDHAIIVARVMDAWAAPPGDPLLYYQGRYRGLAAHDPRPEA